MRSLTRKLARTRVEEDRALTAQNVPALMLRQTASGARVTPANAMFIADVFAAVRVLSDAVASLPLIAYRRLGEERRRVEDGLVVELLRRPSPAQTRSGLLGTLMAHLLLHGNAYVGLYRGADGGVEQLAPLAPDRMHVELRAGVLLYRYTDAEGHAVDLTDRDLIHIRALSTDGLVGLSVVDQAREVLGLSSALTEYAARFFRNDARPSGILKLGATPPDRAAAIADAWRGQHRGAPRAHNIAVVQGDISFEAVGMTAADSQLTEARQQATAEVARVFRIPPSLLGAPTGDSLTYGNRESDAAFFVTHSLRPWLVAIEEAFNASEELVSPGIFLEFLVEGLLRGDSSSRAAFYTSALNAQTGWMTRAEVRRLENLPPEPTTAPAPDAQAPTLVS